MRVLHHPRDTPDPPRPKRQLIERSHRPSATVACPRPRCWWDDGLGQKQVSLEACSGNFGGMSHSSHRIPVEDVRRMVDEQSAQIVEVLPRSAYEAVHIPGALNIPLGDMDEEGTEELDASRPIIVYCYDYQ